jgi:glutamate synthase domain-containing protein 3
MSVVVDASDRELQIVSNEIKAATRDGPVKIRNAGHLHGLVAGLSTGEITIEGESGDYVGVLNNGASIKIDGNAGQYLADNMTSGEVIVNGDGSYGVGQYCYGGTIVIRGNAGDFTAVMNKGATIIIEGDVGDEVATYMLAGDLIILGNAGKNLGNYLIKGNIYIRGDFDSLGHNTLLVETTKSDIEKLQHHFDRYQINAAPEDFRKIVRLSEKPFYKTKEPTENQVEIESITK